MILRHWRHLSLNLEVDRPCCSSTFKVLGNDAERVDYQEYQSGTGYEDAQPTAPRRSAARMDTESMSVTAIANSLQVNRVTLSNLLHGKSNITANMALRMSAWRARPPMCDSGAIQLGLVVGPTVAAFAYQAHGTSSRVIAA